MTGKWSQTALEKRIQAVIGHHAPRSVEGLTRDLRKDRARLFYGSQETLIRWLAGRPHVSLMLRGMQRRQQARILPVDPPQFRPIRQFEGLHIPKLATIAELAYWLEVEPADLDWFADSRQTLAAASSDKLLHYTYKWIPRSSGKYRLLEAPKDRLKAIQRRILAGILEHVPCHEAAHGFVAKRSVLSAVNVHVAEEVLVVADLQEFFPSTSLPRVHALFRRLGYPSAVARVLTRLCSTTTPKWVFRKHPADRSLVKAADELYRRLHLPQGAPTSPSLANLIAFRLDCRLHRLAESLGAHYTRYADDMIFSGDCDFLRGIGPTLGLVRHIAKSEHYRLNEAKTRIMRRSGRQSAMGLVINSHLNIRRESFDALKATLHNCRLHGPANQNSDDHPDFRAHLEGRVAWVEHVNPKRGQKLRTIFDGVTW